MTFRDKIRDLTNPIVKDDLRLLSEQIEKEVLPLVETAINEQAKSINYDGFTWERPAEEYPPIMYVVLGITVKKTVADFLTKNYPEAWFLPFYAT